MAVAQRRAQKRLPKSVYGALVAGSEAGATMADNVAAFGELLFNPALIGSPASRETAVTVMGQPLSMPVMVSPTGVQAVHPDGEVAVARAAAARGVAIGLSSFASKPISDVVQANPQTFFQLYWAGDRDSITERIERARAAGAVGLILTLDWSFSHSRGLGQPIHPHQARPQDHRQAPARGRVEAAVVGELGPNRPPAAAGGAQLRDRGHAVPQILRRLRGVDADTAADLGRRGLAPGAMGRPVHAQGRDARRGRPPGPSTPASAPSQSPTTAATTLTALRRR